jgi:HK97 family phage major capsid protein
MALIDITQRQRRDELFPSLGQWIKDIALGNRHKGFARTLSKSLEVMTSGVMDLPENEMLLELGHCRGFKRGLATTPQNTGGYLVPVEKDDLTDALRPYAAVVAAGARAITAQGNKGLPKEQTPPSAQFLNEGDTLSEASMTISQLTLVPRRAGVYLTFTKDLDLGDTDLGEKVAASLARSVGQLINNKVLNGTGIMEPQGIFATAGVNTVVHSGASTYANVLDYPKKTLDQNANPNGALAWILHPDVVAKWATVQKFAGSSTGLWDTDNTVAGKPVFTTTDAPATGAVFGSWSDFLICFWGPTRLVIDPYEQKKQGKIAVTAHQYCDFGPLWPNLFTINSGSVVA